MEKEKEKAFVRWLVARSCMYLFGGVLLVVLLDNSPLGRDDTDPGQWGARSGMGLKTDSATGCQYLTSPHGGMTVRLNADGRHVGCL